MKLNRARQMFTVLNIKRIANAFFALKANSLNALYSTYEEKEMQRMEERCAFFRRVKLMMIGFTGFRMNAEFAIYDRAREMMIKAKCFRVIKNLMNEKKFVVPIIKRKLINNFVETDNSSTQSMPYMDYEDRPKQIINL